VNVRWPTYSHRRKAAENITARRYQQSLRVGWGL
jgi:hypothetical protein